MALESSKNTLIEASDGGLYSDLYESGNNFALAPSDFYANAASAGTPALAYVQSAAACGSYTATFSSSVTNGDLVIDAFKSEGNTVPVPTDTLGTTLTLKGSMTTGGSNFLWIFAGTAHSTGADTINNVGGASWPCTSIMEISGTTGTVNTTGSLYTGTTPATTNVTTTVAKTFIYSAIGGFHNAETFSAIAGFTDPATGNANGADSIGEDYAIESTAGSYTTGFNIGGAAGTDNSPLATVVFQ
jgi:hypothetical protein